MSSPPKSPVLPSASFFSTGVLGLVMSGGGSRAAYQVGVLKALVPHLEKNPNLIQVIVGSSIGAVNSVVLAGCMKAGLSPAIEEIEQIWRARTYRNTFAGRPSQAFLRALKVAFLKYSSPGPSASNHSIFNPTPLIQCIDEVLARHGGLTLENRSPHLKAVAVMTTLEGATRKPLLFVSAQGPLDPAAFKGATFEMKQVDTMSAKHGLASAALPSVLPPVELDVEGGKVRLVDGGISENVPVDPAARLGAEHLIIIDISGRVWWHDRFGNPHDQRPTWEVPAGADTYCVRPPETLLLRNKDGLGPILRQAISGSRRDFIEALGPTWPIFTILKRRLGEELAYEVMSYVALHPSYIGLLIDRGYHETKELIGQIAE